MYGNDLSSRSRTLNGGRWRLTRFCSRWSASTSVPVTIVSISADPLDERVDPEPVVAAAGLEVLADAGAQRLRLADVEDVVRARRGRGRRPGPPEAPSAGCDLVGRHRARVVRRKPVAAQRQNPRWRCASARLPPRSSPPAGSRSPRASPPGCCWRARRGTARSSSAASRTPRSGPIRPGTWSSRAGRASGRSCSARSGAAAARRPDAPELDRLRNAVDAADAAGIRPIVAVYSFARRHAADGRATAPSSPSYAVRDPARDPGAALHQPRQRAELEPLLAAAVRAGRHRRRRGVRTSRSSRHAYAGGQEGVDRT